MSYGSYYTADYYRNPVPYDSSDIGEPVPGWGTTISIAGPPRIGVGKIQIPSQQIMAKIFDDPSQKLRYIPPGTTLVQEGGISAGNGAANGEPMAWWIWPVAAAVLLGGIGYVGTKQGWL